MPEPLLSGDETAFLSTFCHSQPLLYTSEQALGGTCASRSWGKVQKCLES